jgi:hypothetical protein
MYLCILDHPRGVCFHQNLPAQTEAFRQAIAPLRDALVVAAECMVASVGAEVKVAGGPTP